MVLKNKIQKFLQLEAASGIVLFITALLALFISNSPVGFSYTQLLNAPICLTLGNFAFTKSLLFYINEGLMTLFFLLIGLELKREFLQGELSGIHRIILPATAALGGMLLPAFIYSFITYTSLSYLKGWAIPVATDIAFALGVLSLFGKRVPLGLKLFLMALAIFDDLGAIAIIAFFHSHDLSLNAFSIVVLCILALYVLSKCNVDHLLPYLLFGGILWGATLQSGVHATASGVLLSLMIPIRKKKPNKKAPLYRLEENLHPFVAYLILPLFALANAGLSFEGISLQTFLHPIVLGIIAGLFIGKQLGVFTFSWIMIKLKLVKLPPKTSWSALYGVALLCGIGFTMSLFMGNLAFLGHGELLAEVRLGVLVGSILSAIMGILVLKRALK